MRKLRNTYYLMRHGRSLANEKGVILSDPEKGIKPEWGLSETGRQQVEASASSIRNHLPTDTLIYTSDFSRARETAEIVSKMGGITGFPVKTAVELRERFFGNYDQSSDENYERVWACDDNLNNRENGVESPSSVQERTSSLVLRLEEEYAGRHIILVSHGDALQILQTWFLQLSPGIHRRLDHINTAEIRRV